MDLSMEYNNGFVDGIDLSCTPVRRSLLIGKSNSPLPRIRCCVWGGSLPAKKSMLSAAGVFQLERR